MTYRMLLHAQEEMGQLRREAQRTASLKVQLRQVQEENRLEQKGLLRRFSIICLGKQPSRMDMREEKSKMHKELKPGTKEYDEWFLNYRPGQTKKKEKTKKKSKSVKKKTSM